MIELISNIIYLLATGCLLAGSILTFNSKKPDYFFVTGSALFFINSLERLISEIIAIRNRKNKSIYEDL